MTFVVHTSNLQPGGFKFAYSLLALTASLIIRGVLVAGAIGDESAAAGGLSVGFYNNLCPRAEAIIGAAVEEAFHKDPHVAAGILRLFFHDCWIIGCDATVLIAATAQVPLGEQQNFANDRSLRGMDVIDAAKAKLETVCPGVVSCADILAFAAQSGVALAGGPRWAVEGGRRDGRLYNISLVNELPFPTWNVTDLTQSFAKKGFSVDEMITLSGGHSIGQARCAALSFTQRLNSSSPARIVDDAFRMQLSELCPSAAVENNSRVDLESTPVTFDNQYYWDLASNRGMFQSDQTLYDTESTRATVLANARDQALFFAKFARAMIKLGRLNVLTAAAAAQNAEQQGEIRLHCSQLNN